MQQMPRDGCRWGTTTKWKIWRSEGLSHHRRVGRTIAGTDSAQAPTAKPPPNCHPTTKQGCKSWIQYYEQDDAWMTVSTTVFEAFASQLILGLDIRISNLLDSQSTLMNSELFGSGFELALNAFKTRLRPVFSENYHDHCGRARPHRLHRSHCSNATRHTRLG